MKNTLFFDPLCVCVCVCASQITNMNNVRISAAIRSDTRAKKIFLGTFPCDRIPAPDRRPACAVINTDTHRGKGRHWVAIFLPTSPDKQASYFDSFGEVPGPQVLSYLSKHAPTGFQHTEHRIQGVLASTCGLYCIYFCIMMGRGQSMQTILNRFHPSEAAMNDTVITRFLNKHFDLSVAQYDKEFVGAQLLELLKSRRAPKRKHG